MHHIVNAFMHEENAHFLRYRPRMAEKWQLEYLQRASRESGMSLSAIAKEAGLSSTTLTRPANDPEHKHLIKHTTLLAVERVTGIPMSVVDDLPTRVEAGEGSPDGAPLIPVYDVAASAGHGALVESEDLAAYSLAFPPNYLGKLTRSKPQNLAIISVKGESMLPTLHDDDIVMLDTSKKNLDFDGLFVLRFGDTLHVKRVTRSPNREKITIISDNRELYPAQEWPASEVEVVGKVIWKGGKV